MDNYCGECLVVSSIVYCTAEVDRKRESHTTDQFPVFAGYIDYPIDYIEPAGLD